MADEVMLTQRLTEIADNRILRLIAHTQQLDFIARFLRVDVESDGTFLVFEPNQDHDFKIRVTNTAPQEVANGVMFFGTDDKWRITAATPEEAAAFEEAWEVA